MNYGTWFNTIKILSFISYTATEKVSLGKHPSVDGLAYALAPSPQRLKRIKIEWNHFITKVAITNTYIVNTFKFNFGNTTHDSIYSSIQLKTT